MSARMYDEQCAILAAEFLDGYTVRQDTDGTFKRRTALEEELALEIQNTIEAFLTEAEDNGEIEER